jgi:DNA-binding GntR family transcriptional regulator
VSPIASKYELIADHLRKQIIDGTLPPGTRLPTLLELAAEHGVSERTAIEATKLLLAEDLITSKPGAGYHVRERPQLRRMVRSWYVDPRGGSPWRAEMAAQGHRGSWVSQSKPVAAPPVVAERLRLKGGEAVMRTSYVFTADDQPAQLSTSWEPMAITSGTAIMLPEDGEHAGKGVVERFAAIGVQITRSVEEVSARPLTIDEADKLRARPGTWVLLIERTYYAGETPVETADILVPLHIRPVYEIPVGEAP